MRLIVGSAAAPAARCRNCLRSGSFNVAMLCSPRHGLTHVLIGKPVPTFPDMRESFALDTRGLDDLPPFRDFGFELRRERRGGGLRHLHRLGPEAGKALDHLLVSQ